MKAATDGFGHWMNGWSENRFLDLKETLLMVLDSCSFVVLGSSLIG